MTNGIVTPNTSAQDWSNPRIHSEKPARGSGRVVEVVARPAESEHLQKGWAGIEDKVSLSLEARIKIQELAHRDREVRSHEAAHAATGGPYAGSPRLTYETGPDGRRYAVEGEVDIDTSKIPGDPEKTLEKAETIRRAALAPANPSAADRAIAAKAVRMASEARRDITALQNEKTMENLSLGGYSRSPAGPSRPGLLLNISI